MKGAKKIGVPNNQGREAWSKGRWQEGKKDHEGRGMSVDVGGWREGSRVEG